MSLTPLLCFSRRITPDGVLTSQAIYARQLPAQQANTGHVFRPTIKTKAMPTFRMRVSSKHQLTLASKLVADLGIVPGDEIGFELKDRTIVGLTVHRQLPPALDVKPLELPLLLTDLSGDCMPQKPRNLGPNSSIDAILKALPHTTGHKAYLMGIVMGISVGAIFALGGFILCVLGVSGSIQWLVQGHGLTSRLSNASPGVFFTFLGAIILWRYKPKISYDFDVNSPGRRPREARESQQVTDDNDGFSFTGRGKA